MLSVWWWNPFSIICNSLCRILSNVGKGHDLPQMVRISTHFVFSAASSQSGSFGMGSSGALRPEFTAVKFVDFHKWQVDKKYCHRCMLQCLVIRFICSSVSRLEKPWMGKWFDDTFIAMSRVEHSSLSLVFCSDNTTSVEVLYQTLKVCWIC